MNLNFIKIWVNALTHPRETFEKEKTNSSFLIGFIYLFVGFLFFAFIAVLLESIVDLLTSESFKFSLFITHFIATLVDLLILVAPALLVLYLVVFVMQKLFKRQGTLEQQFYLMSLFISPLLVLYSVVSFLVNYFFEYYFYYQLIVGGLFGIYTAYLISVILTQVQKPMTQNKMAETIIKIILLIIVVSLIIFILWIGMAINSNPNPSP